MIPAGDILPLAVGLMAVAGILAAAMWLGRDAEVTRRVFRRFVVNIALPLVVILGAPLVLVALLVRPATDIWPAIIAGAVIAGGWLTTAIFSELGKAQAKAEKLRDFHKALYAEIGNALRAMWDEGRSEELTDGIVARMQADADFVPFIPREHHDHIFNAVVSEIEVLPRQTIDAIVAYYSLMKSVADMADDMRGERFAGLEQPRRIALYEDYAEMRRQAFILGQFALEVIKAYSDGGAAAADAVIARLNTAAPDAVSSPGADPSAPSEGSG
ncbi:MAG: hypothetical protein KDK53_10155 [Maritimibacter sp.]|nr:hypothetical protein [Maritimibacter sp.]